MCSDDHQGLLRFSEREDSHESFAFFGPSIRSDMGGQFSGLLQVHAYHVSKLGQECWAAPAASTSSALPHPCTLLTAKDAEEVFGAGAQLKRHSDTTCMIEGADPLPDGLISVTITLIDPKDWDASKKNVFATFPEAKFVSGIGEDGYTFSEGIAFHKGKVFVIVSTSGYLGPKPKAEIAKHLAEQVAAHL